MRQQRMNKMKNYNNKIKLSEELYPFRHIIEKLIEKEGITKFPLVRNKGFKSNKISSITIN